MTACLCQEAASPLRRQLIFAAAVGVASDGPKAADLPVAVEMSGFQRGETLTEKWRSKSVWVPQKPPHQCRTEGRRLLGKDGRSWA